MSLENKKNMLNSILEVNDLHDSFFNKGYLDYIKETVSMTHTLEYEDILALSFFFEEFLDSKSKFDNKEMEFPKDWFASLGYEPFGNHDYLVFKNINELNVFNDLTNSPIIYPYILFLIEEGQYIAVDGAETKEAWDYKFL